MIKELIQKALGQAAYIIINQRRHYDSDGLSTIHSDQFSQNPAFKAALRRGLEANNNVDPHCEWRLHVTLWAASCALAVPADFVECGVNTGFMSSAIMEALNWARIAKRFYLLDTFAGPVLSQFSPEEIKRGRHRIAEYQIALGAYETNIAHVRANFAEWLNAVCLEPFPRVCRWLMHLAARGERNVARVTSGKRRSS